MVSSIYPNRCVVEELFGTLNPNGKQMGGNSRLALATRNGKQWASFIKYDQTQACCRFEHKKEPNENLQSDLSKLCKSLNEKAA